MEDIRSSKYRYVCNRLRWVVIWDLGACGLDPAVSELQTLYDNNELCTPPTNRYFTGMETGRLTERVPWQAHC